MQHLWARLRYSDRIGDLRYRIGWRLYRLKPAWGDGWLDLTR